MTATAVVSTEEQKEDLPSTTEEAVDDKPKRRGSTGNPMMRTLHPDMLKSPHQLDFADGMMSDEFAWEKTNRLIVDPLEFQTEKQWLDFAKATWKWRQDAEKREAELLVERLLTEAANNPLVMAVLKQKLAA